VTTTPPPGRPPREHRDRDRDAEGRPRNARPRDATGRPLPYGSQGVEPPVDVAPEPATTLATAQRLLDDGLPFAAHDVLEAMWKAAPADDRQLWRSLAQLAVGLTHRQRGNAAGSGALLRRGAEGLRRYAGARPYGVPVDELLAAAQALAADAATGGSDASEAELRLVDP
jgi:hypothetical protein